MNRTEGAQEFPTLPALPLQSFVDISERIYEDRLKRTFGAVLGRQIWKEMGNPDLSEADRKEFVAKRMPVYTDAFVRGQAAIVEQVRQGNFNRDIFDGSAKINISGNESVVSWKITPNAQDPFERARLIKEMRESGVQTSGNSAFWGQEEIVDAVLQEGLKLQKAEYKAFESIYFQMADVFQGAHTTLSRVGYREADFAKVASIYLSVCQRSEESGREPHEEFILNFVNSEAHFLSRIGSIRKELDEIEDFDDFILEIDKSNYRGAVNTWAVELMTNWSFTPDVRFLRYPKTTVERVLRLSKFAMDLSKFDTFEVACNTFADEAIEERREALAVAFGTAGLSAEVGIRYMKGLLVDYLKNVPEDEFLSRGKVFQNFNGRFSLIEPVEASEDPRERSVGIERSLEPESLVTNLVVDGKFAKVHFRNLPEYQRVEIAETLFSRDIMKRREDYLPVLSLLFKKVNIIYDPERMEFRFEIRNGQHRQNQEWLRSFAHELLRSCKREVDEGEYRVSDALAKIVEQRAVRFHLQRGGYPTSEKDLLEKTHGVVADYLHWDFDLKEAENRLRVMFAAQKVRNPFAYKMIIERAIGNIEQFAWRVQANPETFRSGTTRRLPRDPQTMLDFLKSSDANTMGEDDDMLREDLKQKGALAEPGEEAHRLVSKILENSVTRLTD